MLENKYSLIQKLAVNQKDVNEPLQYLYKPTAINLQTLNDLNRRGESPLYHNTEQKKFNTIFSQKNISKT